MSLHKLDAFLAIVFARRAHKATKIKVHEMWNRLWAIPIISETMARNRFIEIMKFLRFDYKQTRSHRLATDKLAPISTVWQWWAPASYKLTALSLTLVSKKFICPTAIR